MGGKLDLGHIVDVEYYMREFMESCNPKSLIDRLHDELQNTIIDVAEAIVDEEVLVKLLGLYALARAIEAISLGKGVSEVSFTEGSLSDDITKLIHCLSLKLGDGEASSCAFSHQLVANAFNYALGLIRDVKERCLGKAKT